jgi:hypothetical protein
MFYLTLKWTFISLLLIFLMHYLYNFFKNTLTTPKIKDLVNKPSERYNEILNTINRSNIVRNDNVRNDSVRNDSVRNDNVRNDNIVRNDNVRNDNIVRNDNVRNDNVRNDNNVNNSMQSELNSFLQELKKTSF